MLPPFSDCSEDGGCMNVQIVDSSETTVRIYQTSLLYFPEDISHMFFVDVLTISNK